MKKIKIDRTLYEVVTFDEYQRNSKLYSRKTTAIECRGFALPIRNLNEQPLVGAYLYPNTNCMFVSCLPETPEDIAKYSMSNVQDYSKATSTAELLRTQQRVMQLESEILQSSDEHYIPLIRQNDYPELVGFKQAIAAKGIDLKCYAPRLGSTFDNDRRQFLNNAVEKENDSKKKKSVISNTISLKKLRTMAPGFDIKVSLVFQDANPNVVNPMGEPIIVDITSPDAVERTIEDEAEGRRK